MHCYVTHSRTFPSGVRFYRLSLALLAFSAPLGYCIFHNTTATLYYISDCVASILDMFWFLPWLRSALEMFLLLPYRMLCVLTGGIGYSEEAWRKILEILLQEYTERERLALKVSFSEATLGLCQYYQHSNLIMGFLKICTQHFSSIYLTYS